MQQSSCTHSFLDVFGNFVMNEQMKEMFMNAKIDKMRISRKKKQIEVYLILEHIIHQEIIDNIEYQIKEQFHTDFDVVLYIQYVFQDSYSPKQIIYLFWDSLLHGIQMNSPIASGILRDANWEINGDQMILSVKHNHSYYLRKKRLDHYIQDLLKGQLGLNMEVVFEEEKMSREDMKEYVNHMEVQEVELVKEVIQAFPATKNEVTNKEEGTYSSIILGKEITGNVIGIKGLSEESGMVILEGNILTVESREIKGGRYIVSFDITDYEDSITIKCFVKKDKYEENVKDKLLKNRAVRIRGDVQYDKYSRELVVIAKDIMETRVLYSTRADTAKEKRVELHVHTQMSSMDGIASVSSLIQRAGEWGHKAIAITDHGVVQAFPDAASAAKKHGVKVIYGVEAYIVDDLKAVVQSPKGQTLKDVYVVFDIETTGFTPGKDKITEIGAVKVVNGEIVDRYATFVNPEIPIPIKIQELTNITNEMVANAPVIEKVLPEFLEFIEDSVLVAHNANFDVGFIRYFANELSISVTNTVLDTLELARTLFPDLKRHKLNIVAEHLGISLENHHRAVDDAEATAQIFIQCSELLENQSILTVDEINHLAGDSIDIKKLKTHHAVILVQNYTGLKNLYKLISKSHIDYYHRNPRIPKSVYLKYKEGLMIGTACEAGELYRAILENKPKEYIQELVNFYDYLEIQPLGNNQFLIDNQTLGSIEDLKEINRTIVKLGKQYNKPVVATCDIHFLDPKDEVFRRILMAGKGFSDADNQAPLYYRTTDEMLKEFQYLGKEKAEEVVIHNTNMIANQIEDIKPIPDETFPPKIDGAEEELTKITMEKAKSMYGDPLPEPVQARLDRELGSIIKNGFAVLYIIAQKLVWKSLEDGYLVGSRGSVGSSFVATMAGITEVNPLAPHYYCTECQYSDFDSEVVKSFAGGSGCDMPDKDCPNCGSKLAKDGHDIPFETFLGFDGDKEPDIDLNFSGEYQPRAHAYTEELFGTGHVFRAGTIGTLAEKTAYGFVRKYLDEREVIAHNAEINRLVQGCTGVKRTTGQHPGGQMIVPRGHEIYEFCPVQRPANDVNSTTTTTHFDYHSISGRLLKLDILGHDDPTVIRMLEDLTGIDAREIPLDDKKTMSLFTSTEALGVTAEDIGSEVGSFALPEFGTKFVRQMLVDTKPKTFAELIRISGLSHGTDVWLNNAQELVRNGVATLPEVISTRDDIMVYLIIQGVEKKLAFKIMEKVRKGKGLAPEDEEAMKGAGVPDWYIESCKKIKYMFPKAHAAAYVMMAFRIAYFKVYYSSAFYATFFTVRADDFDYELMCKGSAKVKAAIREIEMKGNAVTTKEKNTLTILEIVIEMYARGLKFVPIDLYRSGAIKFQVTEEGILPPLNSLQGLGNTAAFNIVEARKDGEFLSIEEFRQRTKVSKTVIELMKENRIIEGIPETSQLSLF